MPAHKGFQMARRSNTRRPRFLRNSTIPTLYLVNRSGEVVVALEGFDPRYIEVVENKIIQLLNLED